jgi:hypothetical protein
MKRGNNNLIKKIICIYIILFHALAHANTEFIDYAHNLAKAQRENFAPAKIKLQFSEIVNISLKNFYKKNQDFDLVWEQLNIQNSDRIKIIKQFLDLENSQKDKAPTLDIFKNLIELKAQIQLSNIEIENILAYFDDEIRDIEKYRNIFPSKDAVCDQFVSLLDSKTLSVTPNNLIPNTTSVAPFDKYSSMEAFEKDPAVNGAAWLTFIASTGAGYLTIAAVKGFEVANAAFAIFGQGNSGAAGGSVSVGISGSGLAAIVILVAVTAASIADTIYTEYRNAKRWAEYESKMQAIKDDLNAAMDWLQESSILYNNYEYKSLGKQICSVPKWGDNSNPIDIEIQKNKDFFTDFDKYNYKSKVQDLRTNLTDNLASVDSFINSYEDNLVKTISIDILSTTIAGNDSNLKLTSGINYYNSNIKTSLYNKMFKDYLKYQNSCFYLAQIMTQNSAVLDESKNYILNNYKDNLNQSNTFFTNVIDNNNKIIKKTFQDKVNRCLTQNENGESLYVQALPVLTFN